MAFASFDLFAPVIALFATALRGVDRLRIEAARTGLTATPFEFTSIASPRIVNPFPRPVVAPEAEIIVDASPRRSIVRQQAPGPSTLETGKDTIEEITLGILFRSSARFGGRHERL